MKLCKDCKYIQPHRYSGFFKWKKPVFNEYAKCRHEKSANLVDGSGRDYCDISRASGPCFSDAKLFEPKD